MGWHAAVHEPGASRRAETAELGPASDIYGRGATLYHLLAGLPRLFEAGETREILDKVRLGQFPAPRSIRPEIPGALEAICLKAMAIKPEDRYPSARALAGEIENWLADEHVVAYREPLLERARRWCRRHLRLVTGLSAAAAVALVALGVLTTVISLSNRRPSAANLDADPPAEQSDHPAEPRPGAGEPEPGRVADRGRDPARPRAKAVTDFLVESFRKPLTPAEDGRLVRWARCRMKRQGSSTRNSPGPRRRRC